MGEAKQNIVGVLSNTPNEMNLGLPQLMLHKNRLPLDGMKSSRKLSDTTVPLTQLLIIMYPHYTVFATEYFSKLLNVFFQIGISIILK